MYLIPDDIQVKDSVHYAYNRRFRKEGEDLPSRPVSPNHSVQIIHNNIHDESSCDSLDIIPLGETDPVYADIDGIPQRKFAVNVSVLNREFL